MATYNLATSGNWNSNSTWTSPDGGTTFPVAGDTANITGAFTLTVNVSSACAILNFTGFTGTLTVNNTLTVSGNITFVTGFTVNTTAGTPLLSKTTGGTITCPVAGFTWPHSITFVGSATFTISGGDLTINGTLSTSTGTVTINSAGTEQIRTRSVTSNTLGTTALSLTGTTKIVFNQTGGTWTGYISNPVDINITPTASPDLTFTTATKVGGTLTFISGNLGTPNFRVIGTVTLLNTNLATFNQFYIGSNSSLDTIPGANLSTVVTSNTDIACTELRTRNASTTAPVLNSNDTTQRTLTCSTVNFFSVGTEPPGLASNNAANSGSTFTIQMTGTGQYSVANTSSPTNSFVYLQMPLVIDTTGTVTLVGRSTIYFSDRGGFTYVRGTVTPTISFYVSSTLTNLTVDFDTNTLPVSVFQVFVGNVQTSISRLLSDMRCTTIAYSLATGGAGGAVVRVNSAGGNFLTNNLIIDATSLTNSLIDGNAIINFVGTGIWSNSYTSQTNLNFSQPVVINTPGKLTIRATGSGTFINSMFKSGYFEYIAGKVEVEPNVILRVVHISLGSAIASLANTSVSNFININKIPFTNVVLYAGSVIRMNQFFSGRPGRLCTVTVDSTLGSSSIGNTVAIISDSSFMKFSRWVRFSQIRTGKTLPVWAPSTSYSASQILIYGDNVYNNNSQTSWTSGTTPPTHESGTVANGTGTLRFAGKAATFISLSRNGNRNSTNLGFGYFEGGVPYGTSLNSPIVTQPSNCFGISDNPIDPNFF